jgi:hypothetical protein
MPFTDLVRGASLRGSPAQLGVVPSLRLGRAIGTLWRRSRPGVQIPTIVVGRTRGAAEATARDGLVAGLVASGFVVADLGIVESERFTGALRQGPAAADVAARLWPVVGGVLIAATGDSLGVMLFDGLRPVVGPRLTELARTADAGAFCVHGGGQVVLVDTRTLPPAAPLEERGDETLDDATA